MLIGYARVSTQEQETHLQTDALRKAGVHHIFEEKRSGGDRTRPVLRCMLDTLSPGDVLVVFKLDRVARSLSHLLEILAEIDSRGAGFQSLTETIDTRTASGRLMMQMIGAFAEFEREMIRERTKAGMQAAASRGVRFGRSWGIPVKKHERFLKEWRSGKFSRSELARKYGVHLSSIKRVIKNYDAQGRV